MSTVTKRKETRKLILAGDSNADWIKAGESHKRESKVHRIASELLNKKQKALYVTVDENGNPDLDIEADSWEEAEAKLDQGEVIGKLVYEIEVDLDGEEEITEKIIRREGGKWILYTKDGKKKLGEFDTRKEAEERERQIQFFKREKETSEKKVDITENSIRVRVRDPGTFQKGSFRTITIDEDNGIQAVIGRPKGKTTTRVRTFIFDREKWTPKRAQRWVTERTKRESKKEFAENLAERLIVLHETEEKIWYGIPLD